MNPTRFLIVLATAGLLVGCSTTMPTEPSGHLSPAIPLQTDAKTGNAFLASAIPIDAGRITYAPTQWRVSEGSSIDTDEQDLLKIRLTQNLRAANAKLSAPAGSRPVVIRAALTRVVTVSPTLNVISTALLFAPVDRGGASVEVEAVDAETGKTLAAMRFGYYPPISDFTARFRRLAPAELALEKAAAEFSRLLGAPTAKP